MLYFKNNDLAEKYHVSLRTVLNWIEASRQGKLQLVLHEAGNRAYVSNTARNIAVIENIVKERKKYRNSRGQKTIAPKPEFYKLYNQQEVLEIVSSLDIYREIPRQYNYFGCGAHYWDTYTNRLASEDTPNLLNRTKQLLLLNQSYIDALLVPYKRVNIIDIGVGNALPVKEFLGLLLKTGKIGRYIGIDISNEMLEIAGQNITKWFAGKINFEPYHYDITHERFPNLLASEYIKERPEDIVNIVVLFGGTLNNLRHPDAAFKVIHDSMGRNDLLFHAVKLDTEATRRYFDFNSGGNPATLPPQYKFIVDLLNIDETFYDIEAGYDKKTHARFLSIRLKVALSITFNFYEGKQTVSFNKDEEILLWRYLHQTSQDLTQQLVRNEFYPLLMSHTKDKNYAFTISQIDHH